MKDAQVVIVDYGLGNLLSVERACHESGIAAVVSANAADIEAAAGLILPGVGAFADGIAELSARKLVEPIRTFAATGRHLLGICLGMQMLFESADEFGFHKGIGLLKGHVTRLPDTTASGERHKIPHIGWSPLVPPIEDKEKSWGDTILATIQPEACAYFVHSYAANPIDPRARLADTWYHGRRIAAVVREGAIFGCQFHPEKSGPIGLQILANFGKMVAQNANGLAKECSI